MPLDQVPPQRPRLVRSGTAAAAGLLLLSGCGTGPSDAAAGAADAFVRALRAQDGPAACALLSARTRSELEQSSGSPCARAVLDEGRSGAGRLEHVDVFGTMAQARFAEDTVFLSRYAGSWLVVAAACSPGTHRTYDCKVASG